MRIKITDEKCPDCGTQLRPGGSYRTKDNLYQRYSCPKCLKKFTDTEPYAMIEHVRLNDLEITCLICGAHWSPDIAPGGKWYRNAFQCYRCAELRRSR
jgi:ssDNA-binding Zn-finger/Zn-ribbon topoisomerase 1